MFKKYDASASGPDGVARIRCILLPETPGKRARFMLEWTSGSTGCDCEKGTSGFLVARKGELGNTWDVTNMFLKGGYQAVILFYYTKDSHSLPRESATVRAAEWPKVLPSGGREGGIGSRGIPAQLQAERG